MMNLRILLLLLMASPAVVALSEENINQQLDAAPGGKLIIDVDFGTIGAGSISIKSASAEVAAR